MPKNIVICADGTGNSTIKGRGTNVFKLYEGIDENGHRFSDLPEQVAIYHDGVGTESLKWLRAFGGATGWGLSRNVKDLYAELIRVYEPGDYIYLFGFSRGAFTVRTLAGLIAACGIPERSDSIFRDDATFRAAIAERYGDYRKKYTTWIQKAWRLIVGPPPALKEKYDLDVKRACLGKNHIVTFVGVWDTVDAVGLPLAISDLWNKLIYAFKFPDPKLNPHVAVARHALALDEARTSFKPVLWNESARDGGDERIKQVWFAGVHSNVGGGYPHQGMSLVALDWMMTEAASVPELEYAGVEPSARLRFIPQVRDLIAAAADVNGKLYDSRAGLGVFYRWTPRDAQQLCDENRVPTRVHRTVLERIARGTDGYAPGSLPVNPEVVSTRVGVRVTSELQRCVSEAHTQDAAMQGRSLVRRHWATVRFGNLSYGLFVGATVVLALLSIVRAVQQLLASGASAGGDIKAYFPLVANAVTVSSLLGVVFDVIRLNPAVVLIGVTAFVLLLLVDRRLGLVYSEFWHRERRAFGRALKIKDPLPAAAEAWHLATPR